jgi:hypothetical protein
MRAPVYEHSPQQFTWSDRAHFVRVSHAINRTASAQWALFPLRQAFSDDLGRLQGRLGKRRILDDLALNPRAFTVKLVARRL